MIGILPKTLEVGGVEYSIRTDFRVILGLFEIFSLSDNELTRLEKFQTAYEIFYIEYETIPNEHFEDALTKMIWFINLGDESEKRSTQKPVYNWEQDEQIIFSAINQVANKEVRELEHLHWWTFIGYFHGIRECLFTTITGIRHKLNRHEKLTEEEEKYYKENIDMIRLKRSKEEQEEVDRILRKLNGKG